MSRLLLLSVAILVLSGAARAKEGSMTGFELGRLLGAADRCGIPISDAAVQLYVNATVAADDLEFVHDLHMATGNAEDAFDKMGDIERHAACLQTRRVAGALRLLKEP